MKFSIGREASIQFSDSNQHTTGETETETVKFQYKLKVPVANPGIRNVCKQFTERLRVKIPFTMTWSDGATTEGFFEGSYYSNSINQCEQFAPTELNPEGNFDCYSWRKHLERPAPAPPTMRRYGTLEFQPVA